MITTMFVPCRRKSGGVWLVCRCFDELKAMSILIHEINNRVWIVNTFPPVWHHYSQNHHTSTTKSMMLFLNIAINKNDDPL